MTTSFASQILNSKGTEMVEKAAHKMLVLRTAFSLVDPKIVKNTVESSVSFYAFGIYERKSCT